MFVFFGSLIFKFESKSENIKTKELFTFILKRTVFKHSKEGQYNYNLPVMTITWNTILMSVGWGGMD